MVADGWCGGGEVKCHPSIASPVLFLAVECSVASATMADHCGLGEYWGDFEGVALHFTSISPPTHHPSATMAADVPMPPHPLAH
eukprot:2588038-Prymnesium_polylepis.1